MGISVATAGDVNGDGFSDVIVGVPGFDGGQSNEGAAFVYHGSVSGPALLPDWVAESDQSGAHYGFSVSSAGDVNADGYSDIVVGAQGYDGVFINAGAAFVYTGSTTGLSATASTSLVYDVDASSFGAAVASAGDPDGDGYSDIIVGAYNYDGGSGSDRRGAAFLYRGSPSGLITSPGWSVLSQYSLGWYGYAVATAGDVNGDGFSDIIVGRPGNESSSTGVAFLYLGNASEGSPRIPRQLRSDGSAPISLLGRSDSAGGFRAGLDALSPAGRSRVRMELEVKSASQPFDGLGTIITPSTDSGLTGVSLTELATGLQSDSLYRWRARVLDDSPLFPRSRWISIAGNALTEAKLRTGPIGTAAPEERPRSSVVRFAAPWPNPSGSESVLQFDLSRAGTVRVAIYDLAGRRVAVVADALYPAGSHRLRWNGRSKADKRVAAGTYFARLRFGGRTITRKIIRVH
jgi:hypothetical protein